MNTCAVEQVVACTENPWEWHLESFRGVIQGQPDKTGMAGHRQHSEKLPGPRSDYVGVVPSLQRSQPGSEQPKLSVERCMQQSKT